MIFQRNNNESILPAQWKVGRILLFACAWLLVSLPALQARTPTVVEFALRQVWPEVRVEMGSFIWEGPSSIAMQDVVLIERSSGIRLAAAGEARIRWSYGDLLRRKVDEIFLDDLVIHVNTRLLSALPGRNSPGATNGGDSSRGGWSIGRMHCRYAELMIDDAGLAPVALRALFAFDWKDFGTTPDLREQIHKIVLWNVVAGRVPGAIPLVASLDLVEAEISPAGLFSDRVLNRVIATGGSVRAGSELRDILQNHAQGTARNQLSHRFKMPPPASNLPPPPGYWMNSEWKMCASN
jgi:hypothetical protein